MKGCIVTSCQHCTRAFNLVNMLVRVTEADALCPHCGKPSGADPDDLARALAERATLPPLKPEAPWYPGSGGRPRA